MTRTPVIAVGNKHDITLVFPTQAGSYDPRTCAVWDQHSGHSTGSQNWVIEQPIAQKYYAAQVLATYCKWYDQNPDKYQLVAHWTDEYDRVREAELAYHGT